MSSTPKKRPKSKPNASPSSTPPIPHSIVEPPENFFPSKEEFLRLLAVLAIASSVVVTCNFLVSFFNPTQKPFCDSVSDSLDSLSDFCEPCPSNGECYQGKLECVHGYRRQGNLCVEDGDINETAKRLSKWVEKRLCEAYAQSLCSGTGTIWARQSDIWNDLDGHILMDNFGLDNAIWTHTKRKTMETVGKLLESRTTSYGTKELKCPDLLAEHYKPLTCRIRHWITKHVLVIVPVCALLLGCTILLWKVRWRWYLSSRVEELYHRVCDILEENALMSKSVNDGCESWVVASQLRDHLLLPRERRNHVLWKKVEELIQQDSRIDRYPKLVKGETKVVWEWQVEGSLSSRMRRRQESSKSKSREGVKITSNQQHGMLKAEPKPLIF
ncbi:uncharacterized protein LOC119980883 isoform X2 [Tripterygium wilfordii]|uniref:uncharacterized protein LOC119980883 isoform X2 n=1 Tax=Tripterygium wilfordii TaxID=458696 RepID=UPI0018F8484D|nr:uncharacterized protein LOC119980883 isoform X2 [Tripterygium wilfordii]